MNALEQLRKNLRNLNQVALAKMHLGDSLQMLYERSKLEEWVGGTSHSEVTTANTIEAAVKFFVLHKQLKGVRQVRLICYGCTHPFGKEMFRIIEHRELFDKLIQGVASFQNRKRPLRKLYRGLLNSYFSFDPHAPGVGLTGRENWEKLRLFLHDSLDSVLIGTALPDWLTSLRQHRNLLGTQPCQPYQADALQGDWSVFNDLRQRLDIGADSWLIRQMVLTPVHAVIAMDDARYKNNIENILLLLNEYPLYAATGLHLMLDRYALCAEQEVSDALRDYAVSLWGNPWLPENAHLWQCTAAAKGLLSHWLKRHLLKEFFTLLCNDDPALPRRLNFWEVYSSALTGMYFALGKDAFAPGNLPLYKFRHLAKGLVAKLSEGKNDVHACIMQFDHYHVVEFNRDNNMAYFYDTRLGTPPFYLSKGWVEIGALNVAKVSQGMDVSGLSKPLRHQDTELLSWEGRFAQELGTKANVIQDFCQQYQCDYQRANAKDKYEWIRPRNLTDHDRAVWSILLGWGFCFSAEEQSYFRENSLVEVTPVN